MPCRKYHPEHLWEAGALKKAIHNESQDYASEPPMPTAPGFRHEYCLHHIFHCWNANLKREESNGPSFLIHILKRQRPRHEQVSFVDVEDPVVEAIGRAASGCASQIIHG